MILMKQKIVTILQKVRQTRRRLFLIALPILIILGPIVMHIILNPSGAQAWWNNNWLYRKPIPITEHTNQESNVYITLSVDTSDAEKFQSDCGDIRFTQQNGKLLSYYIASGCGTESTSIHVNFDVFPAGAQTIFMYYGNPSVENGFTSSDFAQEANDYTVGTAGTEQQSPGPVAYWKFDEGQGTSANDSTTHRNTGSVSGSQWKTGDSCINEKCLYFDGSDDSVHIDDSGSLYNTQMTISAWIKGTTWDSNGGKYIVSKRGGASNEFSLGVNADGNVFFLAWDGNTGVTSLTSTATLSTNVWYYLSATTDGTTAKIYANGLEIASGEVSGTIGNTGYGITIGTCSADESCPNNSTRFFQGFIDEVKVYPYARSANQIRADFTARGTIRGTSVSVGSNDPSSSLSNNLISYWKMDETTGDAADSSGNGNTISVTGNNNYAIGKFGNGLRAGIETTNYIRNPSAETNTTNWGCYDSAAQCTLSRITTDSQFGSAAFRVQSGSAGPTIRHAGRVTINTLGVSIGDRYCYSAYVKTNNGTVRLLINWITGGVAAHGGSTITSDSWTRTQVCAAVPAGATHADVKFVFSSNADVYIDGIQFEVGVTTPTPYFDGSFGSGYEWNSTAHGSISNRYASSGMTTSTLDTSSGTLSFWFKSPSLDSSAQCAMGSSDGDNTGGIFFALKNSGVTVTHEYASGVSVSPVYTGQLSNNTWHHVTYTWDNATKKGHLYVNNSLGQEVTYSQNITIGAYLQQIGNCTRTGHTSFNGILDEIRVHNRALPPMEITQLYNWAPGPVGYWDFEEGSGSTIIDKSGHDNSGLWNGSGTRNWVKGKYGNGGNFNGSTDFINFSPTPDTGSEYGTMSLWVKSDTNYSDIGYIFYGTADNGGNGNGAEDELHLYFTADEKIAFFIEGTNSGTDVNITSSQSYADNKWHYITATWERGGKAYLYIDGIQMESTNHTANSFMFSESLRLGRPEAAQRYFQGQVDEVRLYNYTRTNKQIIEDMNASHPAGGSPVGSQIGYWKFNEGYGNTAHDSGPQKVHGTITNATWSNDGKFGKALSFNGSSASITLGNIAAYKTQSKTISFWAKPDTTFSATTPVFANGGGNYYVGFATNGTMMASYNTTAGTQQTSYSNINAVSVNEWHHYMYVFNVSAENVDISFYVDGKLNKTVSYTTGYSSTYGTNFVIGSFNGASLFYSGLIDEVKIYNSALTAEEIKIDYNQNAATVLGSGGTDASGSASFAADRYYCLPGATTASCSPIAEWTFEEGQGTTVNDRSGNSKTGTWSGLGNHWLSQGKVGWAGSFNGSNDVVNISSGFDGPSVLSISLWFKTSSTGPLFGQSNQLPPTTSTSHIPTLWITPTGTLRAELWTGSINAITTSTAVNDDKWHHVTLVGNTSTQSLYVDGKLISSRNGTISQTWWTYSTIGAGYLTTSRGATSDAWGYFNGKIDQVRLYNYALSQAQIAWDYNKGKPIAHWKMDECQGAILHDSSGNGITGTISIGESGAQISAGTCATADTAWGNGTTGKFNYSLNFDGTNDSIILPNDGSTFPNDNFTISIWANPNSISGTRAFWTYGRSGGSGRVYLQRAGSQWKINSYLNGNNITGGTATTGKWSHIVFVKNGSSDKLFIDGVQVGSTSNLSPQINAGAGSRYHALATGDGTYFGGKLDDVQFYNYPLTDQQIKILYSNGSLYYGPTQGTP